VSLWFTALLVCGGTAAAAPPARLANPAVAVGLDMQRAALYRDDVMLRLLAPSGARGNNGTLDLSPLAQRIITCVESWGVPLTARRDPKGRKVAISALFGKSSDMPALQLHVGASAAEPFGAFYRHEKGFRLSLIYPIKGFTLRLEGGKRGEYGNMAMAGLQWVHPEQRFAAGFGMPLMLSRGDGVIGAVLQMRLRFN